MPKTEMLINYVPGEECRIAIVQDGKLEEFYQERASAESHVGNIYKAKVTNVEQSIQAAFLDFGLERNGFLHVTDLHPMYFSGKEREEFERVGSKTPHRDRPPIQKCLRRGQEVLVQVLKEGISTKGPTLTSYLSIPGRFLVMMPHMQRLGVSRKVEDDEQRREMREILQGLNPPSDFGFIIRTAGMGQTKADLKRDLAYLQRLWKTIDQRRKSKARVGELYAESDLIIRTIRDVFSNDIDRVVVDELTAARRARDFLAIANPRARSRVAFYDDAVPLFDRFDIEHQIENINARTVPLPSGGSLVIEQTEALVAIDVNSGKSRDAKDAESNAYNTDVEAVDEICRQLRLRDLGGVIVNDLIDMRQLKHRRAIEQQFRNNLKRDRARTRIGMISQFGILEMTRQRMRPSLKNSIYVNCAACDATGQVKSAESVVLEVMRKLALVMHRKQVARLELTISPDVAFHLLNRKRAHLTHLEERYHKAVTVRVGGVSVDYMKIFAFDEHGVEIDTDRLLRGDLSTSDKTLFKDLDDPSLKERLEAIHAAGVDEPLEEILYDDDSEEEPQGPAGETSSEITAEVANHQKQVTAEPGAASESGDEKSHKRRRRRRGGRGRKKNRGEEQGEATTAAATGSQATTAAATAASTNGKASTPINHRDDTNPSTPPNPPPKPLVPSNQPATERRPQTPKAAPSPAPARKVTPASSPAARSAAGTGYSNRLIRSDDKP